MDSCDFNEDDILPINELVPSDDQTSTVRKEDTVFVNFPLSNENSYVKSEDASNSQTSYETQVYIIICFSYMLKFRTKRM